MTIYSQIGHSDGFSTLRPHSLVSKEAEEHQLQSDLREQMQGYKRMRQHHKGQVRVSLLNFSTNLCALRFSADGATGGQAQSRALLFYEE